MAAMGYNVWLHKYILFVISGAFAGIAGVFYAYYKGMIHPTDIGIDTSFLPMVMAIIGGQGTLLGPVVGAAVVILVQYYVSDVMPIRWPLILGSLFVFSIMFARKGLWVYVSHLWDRVVHRDGST
jgi:branched-chain amino acid transport system permease protein